MVLRTVTSNQSLLKDDAELSGQSAFPLGVRVAILGEASYGLPYLHLKTLRKQQTGGYAPANIHEGLAINPCALTRFWWQWLTIQEGSRVYLLTSEAVSDPCNSRSCTSKALLWRHESLQGTVHRLLVIPFALEVYQAAL